MRRCYAAVLTALAVMVVGAVLAQQDEAVLLRYKWEAGQRLAWDLTARTTGKVGIVGGEGTGQTLDIATVFSTSLFSDVLEVMDDGSARVRASFGTMSVDTELPNGQTLTVHIDPATGKVTVAAPQGAQQVQQQIPGPMAKILSEGFVMLVTDRGVIRKVEGMDELMATMARIAGPRASTSNLTDMINWIEPRLPEDTVKPGDHWTRDFPPIFGIKAGAAPKANMAIKHTYVGPSTVEGVKCAKVTAEMEASGIDFTVPAEATYTGLSVELKNLSIQMFFTYNLSLDDGHLVSGTGQIRETGTVRTFGTLKVGDEERPYDQTVHLDGVTIKIDVSRQQ